MRKGLIRRSLRCREEIGRQPLVWNSYVSSTMDSHIGVRQQQLGERIHIDGAEWDAGPAVSYETWCRDRLLPVDTLAERYHIGRVNPSHSCAVKVEAVYCELNSVLLTVSITRYMDKYARLMQILQPITSEVFRGFSQLFELYFHYIFKIFGQRDAFSGTRGQVEAPNLLTARLRATLVRISQGLDDQRSKNSITSNNQPSHMTVGNQPNFFDLTQLTVNQGTPNTSFSAVNMYGLKERYVAVESLTCVAQMLRKSRPHLQTVLTQDALALLDNFYSRTVDVAADLREHAYQTVARLLLNVGGYVDRIGNVRWELKEIGTQHNGYVDLLLGEFKHYANRLAHADIPKEIREILLEFGVDNLAEVLVEAFSRAKRCTHEGRALMSLDLQILISGLRHLAPQRFASNLQVVEVYIKAYYLPETEYLHWVRSHPEYTKAQVISLINIVAYGHKWTRKLRADVLEKIEAGDY
ncbi:hypothetical protein L7F22_068567 [Adiantum nelumboides]|nr:hypothetical protein [Adiantum nelumboides]